MIVEISLHSASVRIFGWELRLPLSLTEVQFDTHEHETVDSLHERYSEWIKEGIVKEIRKIVLPGLQTIFNDEAGLQCKKSVPPGTLVKDALQSPPNCESLGFSAQ